MAYELHGLLAGNVSIVTGENIKPSYGGDDEAFLRKVITPLYRVIEKVCSCKIISASSDFSSLSLIWECCWCQEAKKSRNGRASHTAWCNYDDLNEYFWFVWAWYQAADWIHWFYCLFGSLFFFLKILVSLHFLGRLIASLLVGLCVMMVIFSNQHVMQYRYSNTLRSSYHISEISLRLHLKITPITGNEVF